MKVDKQNQTVGTQPQQVAKKKVNAQTSAIDLPLSKEKSEVNSTGAAQVAVSSRARDMQRMKEIATSAPDVNQEKVQRLQQMIDQGKYKVDSKSIADRMVDEEMLFNE